MVQNLFMANAKPNTRLLCVFFNGKTPMPLGLGGFVGETSVPLPMIPPLRCTYNQARDSIISYLAFVIGTSIFILFKHDSSRLIETPYYLAMDVNFFQKV